MKEAHSCVTESAEKWLQSLRSFREFCAVILLFKLRPPKAYREGVADLLSNCSDNLDSKSRPFEKASRPIDPPAICLVPEKSINEISVGTMNLDAVEAEGLGVDAERA
ncbi:MAG: hypothetical protein WDM89_07070 [Rhizomicrobium sp.]